MNVTQPSGARPTRWYWKLLKFLAKPISKLFAWLISIAVAVLALGAAIAPVLYNDADDFCTHKQPGNIESIRNQSSSLIESYTDWYIETFLYECQTATEEQAEEAITVFLSRSAGADPFRGWEKLSTNLQSRWTYDSFIPRWDYIGYAEATEVSSQSKSSLVIDSPDISNELPFNTFEVAVQYYQLEPKEGQIESQLSNGWIHTSYYHVHLLREGNSWSIDRMISLDQTNGARRKVSYDLLCLNLGASTYASRDKSDPAEKRWTNIDPEEGQLPFYFEKTVNEEGQEVLWYRTSLGWAHASDVTLPGPEKNYKC